MRADGRASIGDPSGGAAYTDAAAVRQSARRAEEINLRNLVENIQPTRERARLVIRRAGNHAIEELWLRRS
jgi:type I pantothenate kinase